MGAVGMDALMEAHMTRRVILILFLLLSFGLQAQVKTIVIAAGTPEDKALQAITAESNAQKRITMLQQFVTDYAGNADLAAYGNWQLAQAFQAEGDNNKALAFGEKAVAGAPGSLDILVSVCGIADAAKEYEKVVEFASLGGTTYNSIASQSKPASTSPEDWANEIARQQASAKQSYDYLEVAGYNAISAEQDGKKRLQMIERYTPAFPTSQFQESISQLAMAAMQNDRPAAIKFGEKMLTRNPNSVPTLLMLANFYMEDPQTLAQATTYAGKAVKLTNVSDQKTTKLAAGMARSTYGFALLQGNKAAAAVPELKDAVELLADNEPVRAEALYRLGFAYAKLGNTAEAKVALDKCLAINGPYQKYATDLIETMKKAPPQKRK